MNDQGNERRGIRLVTESGDIRKKRGWGEVVMVPFDEIDLDDESLRFRVELRAATLEPSLDKDGQQIPAMLRCMPGRARLQVICGFRRIEALRALGAQAVRAHIRADLTDRDAFRLSVLENEEREPLTDIDRGWAIVKYREHHPDCTPKDLAELFNTTIRRVQRLKRLTTFPRCVRQAIADGRIDAYHALTLMSRLPDAPEPDLQAWIDRIVTDQLSGRDLQAHLIAETRRTPDPLRNVYYHSNDSSRTDPIIRIRSQTLRPTNMTLKERTTAITELKRLINVLRSVDR